MDSDTSSFFDSTVNWLKDAAFKLPGFFMKRRDRAKQQKNFEATLNRQTKNIALEMRNSIQMLEGRLKASNDVLAKMRINHEWAMHKERIQVDQERLKLESERHRENIELQRELELKRSQLEAYLATYSRETALQKIQAGIALGQNNPLRATVENILRQQTNPEQIIVILAPYQSDDDSHQQVSVPVSQQYITNEIETFIDRYDRSRVRLLSGAWKDKSYQGATAAGEIFGLLQSEPVLILESTIENDKLTLQAWFWGRNWDRQTNLRFLSNFSFQSVLNRIASRHAHEWQQHCKARCGAKQKEFEKAFFSRPEDASNWNELQQQDQSHGAYVPKLAITNRHWDEFYTILSTWHYLAIGALADGYFLTQYNWSPLLPARFPELLTRITDATTRTELTGQFLHAYRDLLVAYRQERPRDYPHLAIQIATAIAELPDKAPALACAHDAVYAWFNLWGDAQLDYLKPKAQKSQLLALPSQAITEIQARDSAFAGFINTFPLYRMQNKENGRFNHSQVRERRNMEFKTEEQTMAFGAIEYNLVKTAVNTFNELRESMNEHIDNLDIKAEANKLGVQLQEAFAILEKGLRAPKITIAITGGTNSGKSTLINLLTGAELAPVEWKEMTAGLTTFKKGVPTLMIIEDTPDQNAERLWQPGQHSNLSDVEIQIKSKELMEIYNEIRQEHSTSRKYGGNSPTKKLPHPPRIVIHHPNVLDRLPVETLNLPAKVKIELIDLPGVIDPGDQDNINLTREVATSNGICLVVCDASSLTGSDIIDAIVDEAIDSLKLLGSTQNFSLLAPRRILFLLNKIDIPVNSGTPLDDIVERAKNQILAKICHAIPEIEPWRDRFTFVFLSGGLLQFYDSLVRTPIAQRVSHLNKKQNKVFLQADQIEDVLLDLGGRRKAERWKAKQWDLLLAAIDEAKKNFQSADLLDVLSAHIRDHFPVLVLPQLFDPVINYHAKEACDWARKIVTAKNLQNEEQYKQRIRQLEKLKTSLTDLTQVQVKKLDPINNFAGDIKNGTESLRQKLEQTQNQDNEIDKEIAVFIREVQILKNKVTVDFIPSETLQPLFSWSFEIRGDIKSLMWAISNALSEHSSKLEEASKHRLLSVQTKINIQYAIESLVEKGYRRMLKEARGEQYIETQDIALAKRLKKDLNELAKQVSLALQEILQNRLKLEENRFISLLNTVNKAYGKNLLKEVNELTAKYQLSDLNFLLDIPIPPWGDDFIVDVNLDALNVKEETRTKYEERYIKRSSGKTSFFSKIWGGVQDLFLGRKKVVEAINYEVRKIPTARMMVSVWEYQGGIYFAQVANELSSRLNNEIRLFADKLGRTQQQVLDDNIQFIENEAHHVAKRHNKELDYWNEATRLVETMENAIEEARQHLDDRLEYASSDAAKSDV